MFFFVYLKGPQTARRPKPPNSSSSSSSQLVLARGNSSNRSTQLRQQRQPTIMGCRPASHTFPWLAEEFSCIIIFLLQYCKLIFFVISYSTVFISL
jgi:hypothetical protein